MHIATWNARASRPEGHGAQPCQDGEIREIDADIWILTETHEVIDLSAYLSRSGYGGLCTQATSRGSLYHRLEPLADCEACRYIGLYRGGLCGSRASGRRGGSVPGGVE